MAQDSISYEDAFGLKKPDAQTPAAGAAKTGGSMSYEEAFGLPAAKPEGGLASDLGKSLKVGVQRLPGMATGLADLPFALAAGARPFTKAADALGEATGFQPGKWADDTKFSSGYEQGKKAVDDAWKDGSAGDIALSYLKNPGYTANQVAESLPSMGAGGVVGRAVAVLGRVANVAAKAGAVGPAAPGALARAVGEKWAAPVAGGLGEGAVTAGQQMAQYQGDDQQKNALASLGAGVGTGLIGVGAGRVANKLGLETAETAIAKAGTGVAKAADEVPLSAKRRILGGMVSEAVPQELPQSAQEQMWQNWADGKPLMDGVARAATEGAIAGGVMGAGANVSDGGAGKRRAQAEQLDRQNAQAAAARDKALAQEAMQPPTMDTIAGESINPVDRGAPATFEDLVTPAPTPEPDPYTAWDQQAARAAEPAPQREDLGNGFEWSPGTSPGASAAVDGMDFQRDVDTSGLGLVQQPSPSSQLGLRSGPDAGTMENAAAKAVDTGASPLGQALARQQQEVQFLGATGRDVVPRRNGAALGDESNVIDVQAREVPDPRGLPMGQRAIGMGGQEAVTGGQAQQGAPLALPAPTNLREGLERIRQQRAEAVRMAQQNQQGAQTNGTQAQEAQQTSAGQPQARSAQARQQPAALQPAVTGAWKASPAVDAARQAGAQAVADGAPPAAAPGSAASVTAGVGGNGVAQALRGLAQQFTQRNADSGQDTDRTFATVLNQFAHDVQQGKRTPESVQPMLARYQEMLGQGAPVAAAAAPGGQGQVATHKEAGQAAEPATPAVVSQSMQTAARNEGVTPSNMRAWALGEVDKALSQAPSAQEHQAMAGNDPRRYVTFDVPGDGKFKVLNTPEHLQAFRKKVERSPGFSGKNPRRAAPAGNPGVRYGSGTQAAALNAMVDEGDFEAARDYLMQAITAMQYTPGGVVKALAPFKRLLTFGVTVNPAFKVRNLIRDTLSAMAQSDLGYNPLANLKAGFKATAQGSQTRASMLASGGIIRFGTAEDSGHARRMVQKVGGKVLDKQGFAALQGQMAALWDAYQEMGDKSENVNRAALYERLRAKGHSHAEASFMARDLMDFSMSGQWDTVRFLAQTVPFLNARLQGLYKLGRAAKENPKQFAAITGAVAAASLALLAAYGDDDDWKKREDWDRDEVARLLGQMGLPNPAELAKGKYAGLSPKQIDFLLRGYFGWMATVTTTATDMALRPAMGRGERPAMQLRDAFLVGNFVESLPTGSSRYVTQMYEQAKEVEQAWASYQHALKSGDVQEAQSIRERDGDKLDKHGMTNYAKQQFSRIAQQERRIEADKDLSADAKREQLQELAQRKHEMARRVATGGARENG